MNKHEQLSKQKQKYNNDVLVIPLIAKQIYDH